MDTDVHRAYAQAKDSDGVRASPLAFLRDAQSPTEGQAGAGPVACIVFSLKCLRTLSFFCSLVGGNSSDSDLEAGTTVLNLQPRARRFLPEQFSKKAPQAYKMEWKNEVDMDSRQDQPRSSPAAHSKEGSPQTPGVLCQPLLSKGHFGSVRGDRVHEGIQPKPPPRLVRRASEPGNRKGRFGSEKP